MDATTFILAIIAVIFAVCAYEQKSKVLKLKKQSEKNDKILGDIVTENLRNKEMLDTFTAFCVGNLGHNGKWEILEDSNSIMVVKFDHQDLVVCIARHYPIPKDAAPDDVIYYKNCAEELLEKLTEKV